MSGDDWFQSDACRDLATRLGAILEEADAAGHSNHAFSLLCAAMVAGLAIIEPAAKRRESVANVIRELPGQVERMAAAHRAMAAQVAGHG
jgi:hypothetical protein